MSITTSCPERKLGASARSLYIGLEMTAAAGIAPVLKASGMTSYQRRTRRGNRVVKRVLYRSAFSCISHHGRSEAFYRRKRAEGKGHHQAVIALARRRVNVIWAMLRDGEIYRERSSQTA